MPPQYNATVEQVLDFLNKAATDDAFREELEQNPRKVLQEHGLDVPANEIPPHRKLPDKAHCAKLLQAAQHDYAASGPAPVPMQTLMMVVGYAMPLVATAESEVASAG